MKIAIHGRTFQEAARPFVQSMFDTLAARGAEVQLSETYRQFLDTAGVTHNSQLTYQTTQDIFDADFAFSLGGDGTLLDVVSQVGPRQIPIVGINIGRLGFLATVSPGGIQFMLHALIHKKFSIDERSLVSVQADTDIFEGIPFGLNDFTITRTQSSSMITVHTYLDGEFLNSYWADGIIISTPSGSTGYSLSCGGPVLLPQTNNFIITPISPHNLNVRPMVIMDSCKLSFEVESRSGNFLVALDSRSKTVDAATKLHVQRAEFSARLVKLSDDNFLNTLRSKLNWGFDVRN
ncbi:NAD kinase [Fibrivirga algicola]|uniref:NAD kinase n=1 Tax=Fibrivirga algicola TaxID=2950420 RepID=A0ABX0QEJ3_9BACT|nr:NAD kinase [Fibrivirga algicola]ARK12321.1 NAD kinase [Fibrella sp. ES10-3-2-2]NID10839.1 NAD kinase [Fibrivirga algicola]